MRKATRNCARNYAFSYGDEIKDLFPCVKNTKPIGMSFYALVFGICLGYRRRINVSFTLTNTVGKNANFWWYVLKICLSLGILRTWKFLLLGMKSPNFDNLYWKKRLFFNDFANLLSHQKMLAPNRHLLTTTNKLTNQSINQPLSVNQPIKFIFDQSIN